MSVAKSVAASTVRLKVFQAKDDHRYVLNWIGASRESPRDSQRLELFVRFISDAAALFDAWVGFEYFPFLIHGSEWHQGRMIGLPLGVTDLQIDARYLGSFDPNAEGLKIAADLRSTYGLRMPRLASPVVELASTTREIVLVPLSELLRAHYFFLPRALPSLLGGLYVHGSLSSQALQAWDPDFTYWVDRRNTHAHFHRAAFIGNHEAARLARLTFSSKGQIGLKTLARWVLSEFAEVRFDRRIERRATLPVLPLPYERAIWNASVQRLPPHPDGRAQLLVLQLRRFDAEEPFEKLSIGNNDSESEVSGSDPGGVEPEPPQRGKTLVPDPSDPLTVTSGKIDGRFAPIAIEDVLTVDRTIKQRNLILTGERRERRGSSSHPTKDPVDEGGLLSGSGGTGRAPVVFGSDTDWPDLDKQFAAVANQAWLAAAAVVSFHEKLKIDAHAKQLPELGKAFSFKVPRNESLTAQVRAQFRQYFVLEVRVSDRFAYVIEPQLLHGTESFPLGVFARSSAEKRAPFRSSHIERVALIFEEARRDGSSWTAAEASEGEFDVWSVRHPPRERPSQAYLAGFRARIVERLFSAIGDARAIPNA